MSERVIGKWDKLADGSWGVSLRVGGRGESMVGAVVPVATKDKRMSTETLAELVRDYGAGDVAIYRVAR